MAPTSTDQWEAAGLVGAWSANFGELTTHRMFSGLYGRMAGGWSSPRIVDWLWTLVPASDRLGSDHVTRASLVRRLNRFRAYLPEQVLIERTEMEKRFYRIDSGLDALAEMDANIRHQKVRVAKFGEQELKFPTP